MQKDNFYGDFIRKIQRGDNLSHKNSKDNENEVI